MVGLFLGCFGAVFSMFLACFFVLPSIIRTSLSPFPLPGCCKLDRINTIAQENGLISEEEMVGSVEHLVLGHFKREERDEYGVRTTGPAHVM